MGGWKGSRRGLIAGFWVLGCIYVASVTLSYQSSQRLHIGTALLGAHVHQAWWTEALPWTVACLGAWSLSVRVTVFSGRSTQIGLLFTLAAVTTAWVALQPLSYSMDVFRYLWDGRLFVHGINPYAFVPDNPYLAHLQHWKYWNHMAWKHWPEAYPPLAQLYFGAIAWLTDGSIFQYKLCLLVNFIASAILFLRVLTVRRGNRQRLEEAMTPPHDTSTWWSNLANQAEGLTDQDIRSLGLLVLFPPLLVEGYGVGHVDVFAIPWLLLAWLFWLRHQPGRMGAAIAMATAIKLYPVVLFAAFWSRRNRRDTLISMLTFAATLGLLYLPFLSAGRGIFAYFHAVAGMSYNGSVEHLLAKMFGSIVDNHSTLLVAGCVLLVWLVQMFTRAQELPMERKVCLLGLTFMLASPLLHPWYLLSLLPFALVTLDTATLWLSVAVHFTYDELVANMFIEYIPTYGWYFWQWRSGRTPVSAERVAMETR